MERYTTWLMATAVEPPCIRFRNRRICAAKEICQGPSLPQINVVVQWHSMEVFKKYAVAVRCPIRSMQTRAASSTMASSSNINHRHTSAAMVPSQKVPGLPAVTCRSTAG
nr:unnamed protein product [Haemonchus contortus]